MVGQRTPRALYDDRIEPDMPRKEALKLAREIIAELVAEARAGGAGPLAGPME